jgi:Xaa-Pro aminopeptidase
VIAARTPLERREALMAATDGGVLVVRGQGPGGVNPNFVYLTGLYEPRGVLLLASDGVRIMTGRNHPGPDYVRGRIARALLFLPATDPVASRWGEDSSATTDSVTAAAAGVDAVLPIGQLGPLLEQALSRHGRLHYVRAAPASLSPAAGDPDAEFVAQVRRGFFAVEIRDATPAVHRLRRAKDAGEIERIERAAAVTAEAFERLLASPLAGRREHEIEAEITHVYRSRGATHAFEPIVAGGSRAVLLHYTANRAAIAAGEILLVDTGARLDGYCSDVTRCIPVGGRFTARQREVYDTVLRAEREAIALCRPGALLAEIHARTWEVIAQAGFGEQFIHGTSHHIGLETHDVGDVHQPLEAGCVVTIEPGIYLPDESLGVRIEDDVLVTERGPRVLTAKIPVEAAEIERRSA